MTRKHFIEFANMLASHAGQGEVVDSTSAKRAVNSDFEDGYEAARLDIGRSLAAICRTHNPNFDAVKFFEAAKLS